MEGEDMLIDLWGRGFQKANKLEIYLFPERKEIKTTSTKESHHCRRRSSHQSHTHTHTHTRKDANTRINELQSAFCFSAKIMHVLLVDFSIFYITEYTADSHSSSESWRSQRKCVRWRPQGKWKTQNQGSKGNQSKKSPTRAATVSKDKNIF